MYLTHISFCNPDDILKILKDGWIRPSSSTCNQKLSGLDGSIYIYMMIESKKQKFFTTVSGSATSYFDTKMLKKRVFHMNKGWEGEIVTNITNILNDPWYGKAEKTKTYNGKEIKYEDIKLILRRFIKEIKKHLKKQGISETALKILDKNRQTLYPWVNLICP